MSFLLEIAAGILTPLLAAAGLGAVVGWERESWQKPPGLRTHMMVALGSATFTRLALGTVINGESSGATGDPSRIIAGIATGIGFLGAGSIIQSRGKISGLTSAAGIWVVGGVGACCGAGEYSIAIIAVLLAVVILAVLPRVEVGVQNSRGRDSEEGYPERHRA